MSEPPSPVTPGVRLPPIHAGGGSNLATPPKGSGRALNKTLGALPRRSPAKGPQGTRRKAGPRSASAPPILPGVKSTDNAAMFEKPKDSKYLARFAMHKVEEIPVCVSQPTNPLQRAMRDALPPEGEDVVMALRSADHCHRQAHIKLSKGEFLSALASFRQAFQLDAKHFKSHISMGVLLDSLGKSDLAIACFKQAAMLHPSSSEGFYNSGITLHKMGQYDAAIQAFTNAIEVDARNADLYLNRALSYRTTGDYQAAVNDYIHSRQLLQRGREDESQPDTDALIAAELARIEKESNTRVALTHLIESAIMSPSERTEEDVFNIVDFCKNVTLLREKPIDVQFEICGAMHYQKVQAGVTLFDEGEKGTSAWVILSGSVVILKREKAAAPVDDTAHSLMGKQTSALTQPQEDAINNQMDGDSSVEAATSVGKTIKFIAGQCFGDQALLSKQPRPATVCVSDDDDAEFLVISRSDYNRVLKSYKAMEAHTKRNILPSMSIFSEWPADKLARLAGEAETHYFQPEKVVLRQGDPIPGLFIIGSGSVVLWRRPSSLVGAIDPKIDPVEPLHTGGIDSSGEASDKPAPLKSPTIKKQPTRPDLMRRASSRKALSAAEMENLISSDTPQFAIGGEESTADSSSADASGAAKKTRRAMFGQTIEAICRDEIDPHLHAQPIPAGVPAAYGWPVGELHALDVFAAEALEAHNPSHLTIVAKTHVEAYLISRQELNGTMFPADSLNKVCDVFENSLRKLNANMKKKQTWSQYKHGLVEEIVSLKPGNHS